MATEQEDFEALKRDIPEPIMKILEECAQEHSLSVDEALAQLVVMMSKKRKKELDLQPMPSMPPIDQKLKDRYAQEVDAVIARMEESKDKAIKVVCQTAEDQRRLLDQYIVPEYLPEGQKAVLQRMTIKQLEDGLVAFLPPSEIEKSGDGYYPVYFI